MDDVYPIAAVAASHFVQPSRVVEVPPNGLAHSGGCYCTVQSANHFFELARPRGGSPIVVQAILNETE